MSSHSASSPSAQDLRQASTTAVTPEERLLLFAKFPEAGQVKTRLIPALGEEGAARLHRALLKQSLAVAAEFTSHRKASAEVWMAGGEAHGRSQLLADCPFPCLSQQGSDLGVRLQHAVAEAFRSGVRRVVVIGSDCPDLTPERLSLAFESLQQADVVLGPALDGGYYLIGLRLNRPALFEGIAWGTETVLKQTVAQARKLGCTVRQLEPLTDVDFAEDLVTCRRVGGDFAEILPRAVAGRLSVIIPTLNEEAHLEQALRAVVEVPGVEVIVADGSSTDRTVEIAQRAGAKVVCAPPGRGRQLNAGAALASGEVLLFLHADTRLPEKFQEIVWSTLDRGGVAGAFRLRIDAARFSLRCVEWGANIRSRWRQMPYGDQGLFVRSEAFYALGGFPNWPLMEDYELCRRLRKAGGIRLANESVSTSARRWLRLGVWRAVATNQLCIAAFHLGVSPQRLARWYAKPRTTK